jgi:hypothetical protein
MSIPIPYACMQDSCFTLPPHATSQAPVLPAIVNKHAFTILLTCVNLYTSLRLPNTRHNWRRGKVTHRQRIYDTVKALYQVSTI